MADKPNTTAPAPPKPAEANKPPVQPDMGTFVQSEPKPEDYPPSARVAPPAEQINSAASQVIGVAAVPEQAKHDAASDPIAEGQAMIADAIAEGHDKAQRVAELKAELREHEQA